MGQYAMSVVSVELHPGGEPSDASALASTWTASGDKSVSNAHELVAIAMAPAVTVERITPDWSTTHGDYEGGSSLRRGAVR
jgi:hypothetical protein